MAGTAFLSCCGGAKLARVEGYLMEEARRDGEMWVSMLLLGAAEHPVSQLLGLHSAPLLPSIYGCQLHHFFSFFEKRKGSHALLYSSYVPLSIAIARRC